MMIWEMRSDGSPQPVTFGTFHGLQERTRSFDAMAVMKPWQPAMVGTGLPERFEGQRVSADYFRALGISPVLGRDFQVSDDQFRVRTWWSSATGYGGCASPRTALLSANRSNWMTTFSPLSV